MSDVKPPRPGEVTLTFTPDGPPVHFIGQLHTPWGPGDCPRSIAKARESGKGACITLAPSFAPALLGLSPGQAIIVIYWMDKSRRDLLVQNPRHTDGARGTFALRSPARPNPLAQSVVVITELDVDRGQIDIDAIDCFDGTPVVDIKPWLPSIDTPPSNSD